MLSFSTNLLPPAYANGFSPLSKSGTLASPSAQALASGSSIVGPAEDSYTPSAAAQAQQTAGVSQAAPTPSSSNTANQRGPETTLDGNTLAQNQVISASLAVRLALIQAMNSYRSPEQQAWSALTHSLASGDIAGAQTALANYTQGLSADPENLSSLTAPSAKFVNDLATLGTTLKSGDLAAARANFQTAEYDTPDNVLGAFATALDAGNLTGEVSVQAVAVANMTNALMSLGYTADNAKVEANIIQISAVAGLGTGNSVESAQTDTLITDLAKDVASGPALTAGQVNGTSQNMFSKIFSTILAVASPAKMTHTLELLASAFGPGASNDAGASGNANSKGPDATDGVSVYA